MISRIALVVTLIVLSACSQETDVTGSEFLRCTIVLTVQCEVDGPVHSRLQAMRTWDAGKLLDGVHPQGHALEDIAWRGGNGSADAALAKSRRRRPRGSRRLLRPFQILGDKPIRRRQINRIVYWCGV